MKKLLNISLAIASFITTNSFISTFNFKNLQEITKESNSAKDGTGTCIGK